MKFSQMVFKPLKNPPSNADTLNHQLLVQAGFVRQVMAGVYGYTPLGLRVLNKISAIVRRRMDELGSQEVLLPALGPKANWVTTGGWDSVDVLFKLKSQTGREYALNMSHEEIVVPFLKEEIQTYKDLPVSVYQIQWKFRDELRAKSGILRGREFLMKDMYSFHATHEDFLAYYEKAKQVYLETFQELGLDAKATQASGGNFSDKISYEFMVLTNAGEDDILYCDHCDFCINTEIVGDKYHADELCPDCGQGHLQLGRASEAGNVFDLGQGKSEPFKMVFKDAQNQSHVPYMGCYGIGISRAMGIIVEKHADEQGIVWPKNVAPFQVHLITLGQDEKIIAAGQKLYADLTAAGFEVLYDDRTDNSAGQKFAAADLIGCPIRLVMSPKTTDQQVEFKLRSQAESQLIDLVQLTPELSRELA